MIDRYDDDKMAVMKRNLKRWKENAQEITKVTNSKKISKYITDVYKTMKARIMWKSLGGKLKFSKFSQETKELINYIKKLVGLQTFINDITDKIKKDGLDKLKTGDYWLRMIEVLNKFFGIQDEKNKLKIIKKYLNRWKNNVERMIIRDNKLDEALDNVNKRLYIDNANASSDIFLVKKVNDLVPYARAKDFFKNLRILSDKWDLLVKQQGDRLGDLFDRLLKNYGSLLKRKLIQWKNTSRKITEQTAQKRIADFIKNKFRIMNARDNWQRISKSLSMYAGNKDLYSLLRILRKRMALQSMCKSLDDAFKKPALDQLRDGADYLNLINFLKRLFGDWENRNVIASLHHFMIKWKTKAYKIKARDEKINKALSALDNRILTNSVSTMGNMFLIKKFNDTIPAARAAAFLERTKKRAEMMRVLGEQQVAKIKRYIHRLMRSTEEFLREKLLQWKNTAMKTKEETAKRKIAKMIENKYKTNLARAQWKNLSDKYDLFVNNSLIYYVRARLRNWLRLRDMMEKLNNQFKKVGYDQFREAAKLDHTIGFLQGLFNNWEGRNNFLIKRFYMKRWVDKINRLRQRDQKFGTYMKEIDKQFIINSVNTITDASLVRNVTKAVPAARAADFFTNLRRLWGDWDKIRKRILNIMGKYLESEEEKRINYLKRKLWQWNEKAKKVTEEVVKNKVSKWIANKYKIATARKNWKDLSNKYDMYVNKTCLYQLKSRLRNWLKLRDMAEKLRNRLTVVGVEQLKEGLEFKKILVMMRQLFENWEERNKFLAKRFMLRKWFMQVKKLKERDAIFDKAMSVLDKKSLADNVNTISNVSQTQKVLNAVPVARSLDFFNKLRIIWKDYDKIRKRFMAILGKYVESEEEKRIGYMRRKLIQWNETAKKITTEIKKSKAARWIGERFKIGRARKNWKDLADKYDMFKNNNLLWEVRRKLINGLRLRDMFDKLKKDLVKTGYDQFKEGAKFNNQVRYLRSVFSNDDRYYYPYKIHYFQRWVNKTRKLREREEALKESFNLISKKSITLAAETIKDACLVRGLQTIVPVARSYDFLDRLRKIAERKADYFKFRDNLVSVKDEVDAEAKYKLIRRIYKVYYYKLLDRLFGRLQSLQEEYKRNHANYLFYKLLLTKRETGNRIESFELSPTKNKLSFKGKSAKRIKAPEDKSVTGMILPSLVRYLDEKFIGVKAWAMNNLINKWRAEKFAKMYKIFSNKITVPPKRDLVDLMKAEYLYMNGLGASNCELFKLLRRYWIRMVCTSMYGPSRVYKTLYLIKMIMMHKAIAYQRYIRELIRKWRFSAFIQNISRRKLELLYKNLHVSYLQMANEMFGDKGEKNASVVKEFERLATRMGIFTNEDYNNPNEENFCERINKKYVFQPMQVLLEREGPSQFFCSGIEVEDSGENNEDYYVDQEIPGETIGKYKQETSKSNSRIEKIDKKY
jgi:hypothetical protein